MRKPKQTKPILSAALLGASCASGLFSFAGKPEIGSPVDTIYTQLNEVEVKGARSTSELAASSPAPRINAASIIATGITDISSAMRRLPGVNLTDQGGTGTEKTISVRGLGSQHTSILYDGFPINDIRRGSTDISRFTLDNLSEIKVNIGDGDGIFIPARYSSSASSLEITSIPIPGPETEKPKFTASVRTGSFGLVNPSVSFAKSNGKDLSLSVSGDYVHAKNDYPFRLDNGEYTVTEKRQNSELDSGHAEINGYWRPKAGSSLSAKGYFFTTKRRLPGPALYYADESHERLNETNTFGQTMFRTRLPYSLSLKVAGKFNWSQTHYSDENGKYAGGKLDQVYNQSEAYGTAALLYTPLTGLSFDYSVDYFYNGLESNLADNISPFRHSLLQMIAAQWQYKILKITAKGLYSFFRNGSRKESEKGKNAQRLSPSVSLSIKPLENSDFYLRASYKNIFRMPTFNELYFDHFGSINLNPEDTDLFNLGATWGYGNGALESLRLTVDGYFNTVRNKIVAVPYNMFLNTMTNLGKVYVYGVDLSLETEISIAWRNSLLLTGAWSYQRAEIRTSPEKLDWKKQVAYTPEQTGSGSLTWKNPWVNVVAHFVATGERYATSINLPSSRIAGYVDAGFTLFRDFRFKSHSLELRGDLINAFNRQYELIARYPMPGRSWQATITFRL